MMDDFIHLGETVTVRSAKAAWKFSAPGYPDLYLIDDMPSLSSPSTDLLFVESVLKAGSETALVPPTGEASSACPRKATAVAPPGPPDGLRCWRFAPEWNVVTPKKARQCGIRWHVKCAGVDSTVSAEFDSGGVIGRRTVFTDLDVLTAMLYVSGGNYTQFLTF